MRPLFDAGRPLPQANPTTHRRGIWMARMTSGLAALVSLNSLAQDRADLERTRIVGNRELPKVTYIVPWKRPSPDALQGRPPVSVLDELLAPVDRDVHRREVAYHLALRAPATPAAAAHPSTLSPPAAPSTPVNPPRPEKKP